MTSQDISTPINRHARSASGTLQPTVALLTLTALAWVGTVAYARHMGSSSGTMGMSVGAFLPMWVAMMTAMMLPAVAPAVAGYTRTATTHRAASLSLFVGGYLLVWATSGIPVFGLLRITDHIVSDSDTIMRNIAAGVLVTAGLYQLSPLKSRYLASCRSPLKHLSHDPKMTSAPLGDVKIGSRLGLRCLACSWALMALFIAFGVMNVYAMIALATVVIEERLLPRAEIVARWAGAACLVLAALVLTSPYVAAALVPITSTMHNMK